MKCSKCVTVELTELRHSRLCSASSSQPLTLHAVRCRLMISLYLKNWPPDLRLPSFSWEFRITGLGNLESVIRTRCPHHLSSVFMSVASIPDILVRCRKMWIINVYDTSRKLCHILTIYFPLIHFYKSFIISCILEKEKMLLFFTNIQKQL